MGFADTMGARVSLLAAAAALTAGCQTSPAAPGSPLSPSATSAPIANFAGDWHVVFHVESCIGRYCYTSQINRNETLNLRLTQIGDRVTGLVGGADVDGVVAPDGTLSLRGFAPAAPAATAASFELKQFDVRLDAERGLSGRLEYAALMSGEYSGYSSGSAGPIVSATRYPLDTTSFTGRWSGYYSMPSCAPASLCPRDTIDQAAFSLSDAGGPVTGTVTIFPYRVSVTGQASGGSAELRGQLPWGRDHTAEIVVRVRRSPAGRLTGSVELRASNGLVAEFALVGVVPQPLPG